jgi:opacity protein-like surface antigen
VRKLVALAFLCLLATGAALAQIPKGNIFVGYSYARADVLPASNPTILSSPVRANLNGWNASLEGKLFPFVGMVADISSHYGGQDFRFSCEAIPSPPCTGQAHVNSTLHSYLFGPRLSVAVGKFTPFAHALFGASHISSSGSGFSGSDTSFAEALGGGIDYKLISAIAWRFQGDLLQTRFFSTTQNNVRLSTGIVIRF